MSLNSFRSEMNSIHHPTERCRYGAVAHLIEQVENIQLTTVHITRNANRSIINELRRLEVMIRICGFHIFRKNCDQSSPYLVQMHRLYSVLILLINLVFLSLQLFIVYSLQKTVGLISIQSLSVVINATKPLQVIMNILSFLFFRRRFEQLLTELEYVTLTFSNVYKCHVAVSSYLPKNVISIVFLVTVAFVARTVHYLLDHVHPGDNIIEDLSLILAPLLVLWQVVPLLVFSTFNGLIQKLVKTLRVQMKADGKCLLNLDKHYKQFTIMVKLMKRFNAAFEFYIIQTYIISVMNLSVALYFTTRAKSAFVINASFGDKESREVVFMYFWSAFQVFIAITHITVICLTASKTNQKVHSISATLLYSLPSTDKERSMTLLFIEHINNTEVWQLMIWKVYPFHRRLLFTIFGIMTTFTVILLRLRESPVLEPPLEGFRFNETGPQL